MIYLIGGPPKCGKSTLAKQLSQSRVIPWLSTDSLQDVSKLNVPQQNFATKFPASAMRHDSNDEKYAKHSAQEIITAYRQQAETVYPAIEAFVASELADGNDYIVEGYHVEPVLISELILKFPKQVRGILVIKKDATALVDSFHASTTPNDWILERTEDQATFPKIASMITEYSSRLEAEAKGKNIKVFCVDENFDTQLQEAVRYLVDTV